MSRSKCLIACVVAYTAVMSVGCQRTSNAPAYSPANDVAEVAEIEIVDLSDLPDPSEFEDDVDDLLELSDFEDDLPAFRSDGWGPPTLPQSPTQPANFSYQVVRQNPDGSHAVEVTATTTTWETRTRVQQGPDGQERQVAVEVPIPVTRTMLITAPPHVVDIEQYLAEQLAN